MRSTLDGYGQKAEMSSEGGIVTSWTVGGVKVLYPFSQLDIAGQRKDRGGMFAAFPNFGTAPREFGLPKHGYLRTLDGVMERDSLTGAIVAYEDDPGIFGNKSMLCHILVETYLFKGKLEYSLTATVPKGESKQQRLINPGFHPYLCTPQGTAEIHVGGDRYNVIASRMSPVFVDLIEPRVKVCIPGLGRVEMVLGGAFFASRAPKVVIWRDRKDYVCVEPILGGTYGGEDAFNLSYGNPLKMSCALSLHKQ